MTETHSGCAGLDYPGVGPEHAFLKDTGRAEYVGVTDDEALAAFHLLAKTEGILAALESSHAIAQAIKMARDMPKDAIVLCNLSGRGDKDGPTIAAREGLDLGTAENARILPPPLQGEGAEEGRGGKEW